MTTQDLINTLQQGCAITPRLSRKILERLSEQEYVISGIRQVTALPNAPAVELPGLIENLLSELADRQIRADIAAEHEPVYDDWAPEDKVVPRQAPSCRGCLRLVEIDGRLMCGEARSQHYGGTILWPGPGCVWAGTGDAVYGGGR